MIALIIIALAALWICAGIAWLADGTTARRSVDTILLTESSEVVRATTPVREEVLVG